MLRLFLAISIDFHIYKAIAGRHFIFLFLFTIEHFTEILTMKLFNEFNNLSKCIIKRGKYKSELSDCKTFWFGHSLEKGASKLKYRRFWRAIILSNPISLVHEFP